MKIGVLVNFSIPKLKFYKIAKLFIVSVSLARGFFEGTRKNNLDIFRAKVPYSFKKTCNYYFFSYPLNASIIETGDRLGSS